MKLILCGCAGRFGARQWKNAGNLLNISCASTVLVETIPSVIAGAQRNARSAASRITLCCTKRTSFSRKTWASFHGNQHMPPLRKSRRVRRHQLMKLFRTLSDERQLRTRIARLAWWSFLSEYMETTIHRSSIRPVYWIAVKKSRSVPNLSFKSCKHMVNQRQTISGVNGMQAQHGYSVAFAVRGA